MSFVNINMQNCYFCHVFSKESICIDCQKTFIIPIWKCIGCACELVANVGKCGLCLNEKRFAFDNAYSIYSYTGSIANLIKDFKFYNKLFIGSFFSQRIYSFFEYVYSNKKKPDLIITMPIHSERLDNRGFNQVNELVSVIKKKYPHLVDFTCCKKIKFTEFMTAIEVEKRKKVIKNAFSVSKNIVAQKVLLIDDIITTGASCNELVKVLKKNNSNIKQVDIMSLARA